MGKDLGKVENFLNNERKLNKKNLYACRKIQKIILNVPIRMGQLLRNIFFKNALFLWFLTIVRTSIFKNVSKKVLKGIL